MSTIYYKNKEYAGGGGGFSDTSNIYSTQEQIIGTWIDGNPVYRKVFDNTNKQYGTTNVSIDISNLDVNVIISLDAYGTDQDNMAGSKFTINGTTSNANRIIYVVNDNIIVRGSYYSWYIIIEYTKNTVQGE